MEYRTLGATGLRISEIGFGCGDTAGLMISGTPERRRDAIAHALELGINYFDTAPVYGDTWSETNLGQALRELGVRPVVATKVRILEEDVGDLKGATIRSLEASLRRLGLDSVDVLHLHNRVGAERGGPAGAGSLLSVGDVLGPNGVLEGFERLREQGKVRAVGFCAFGGEVPAMKEVIDTGRVQSIMPYYNLLNPTAGRPAPPGFEGPDYGQIIDYAAERGLGVVVLRILAAGALAGLEAPHPLSRTRQTPEYQAARERTPALQFLVEPGEQTLAQAAIRFGLMKREVSSVLVGISERAHIDEAAACSGTGALPASALARIEEMYAQ